MALKSFNNSGTSFLQLTSDNRLTLWDTASGVFKQQFFEDDHLTAQYTSLAYVEVEGTEKNNKRRKLAKNNAQNQHHNKIRFAALGNNRGKIVIWDLNKSEIVQRVQADTNQINDLVFSNDGSLLYVASTSKYIVVWDVESANVVNKFAAGKHGVKKICLSEDGTKLLTASSGIKLWDVKTMKKLKRFSGHHSQVTALGFVGGDRYIISGGGDRFLNLWSLTDQDDREKMPLALLAVQYAPTSISSLQYTKSKLRVAVGSETDSAYLWDIDLVSVEKQAAKAKRTSAKTPDTPSSTFQLADSTQKILGSHLTTQASSKGKIMLAVGSTTKPQFKDIGFLNEDGEYLKKIAIALDDAQLLGNGVDKIQNGVSQQDPFATTLGIADSAITNPSKDETVDGALEDIDNRPLAQRVEDITKKLLWQQKVEEDSDDEPLDPKELASKREKVNTASSLSSVLEQALQGGDKNLLELCLQNRNAKVIQTTVRKLNTSRVLQFLQIIVRKFEVRPSRGAMLLVWIRAVLESHAAFLLTIPNLSKSLNSLYQAIEARVATYKKLSKLSGRLDFIMTQVSSAVPTQARSDALLAAKVAAEKSVEKTLKKAQESSDDESDEIVSAPASGDDSDSDEE